MLSVRLPDDLETQLNSFCKKQRVQKSTVVQLALRKHLAQAKEDPLLAMIGSGNGKYTTEKIMKISRGADWNKA